MVRNSSKVWAKNIKCFTCEISYCKVCLSEGCAKHGINRNNNDKMNAIVARLDPRVCYIDFRIDCDVETGLCQMISLLLLLPLLIAYFFLCYLFSPFYLIFSLLSGKNLLGFIHSGLKGLEKLSIPKTAKGLHDQGRLNCIGHSFNCTCCQGKCCAKACAVLLVLLIYLPVCMVVLVVCGPFVALGYSLFLVYVVISFWVRKSAVLLYMLLIDKSLQF